MELSDHYTWEIETTDGEVYARGGGKRWQDIPPETVLRASLVSAIGNPRVDVFCGPTNPFKGWFGKGYIKQSEGWQLAEYAQCIETEHQRVWVLSGGQVLITHPEYILRV